MKRVSIIAAIALAAVLGAILPMLSSDPMLGCFSTHPRKPAEFRIEQQQGQYFVSFNRDDQWQRDTTPLQVSSRADIARFFKDDVDQIDKALVRPTGGFGIFHFNPGATLKGKDKDSDYMGQPARALPLHARPITNYIVDTPIPAGARCSHQLKNQ